MIFGYTDLCSLCQTGKDVYKLDSKMPFCPYMFCNDGIYCAHFKRIAEGTTEAEEKVNNK